MCQPYGCRDRFARWRFTFAKMGDWERYILCYQVEVTEEIKTIVRMVEVEYVFSAGLL